MSIGIIEKVTLIDDDGDEIQIHITTMGDRLQIVFPGEPGETWPFRRLDCYKVKKLYKILTHWDETGELKDE